MDREKRYTLAECTNIEVGLVYNLFDLISYYYFLIY